MARVCVCVCVCVCIKVFNADKKLPSFYKMLATSVDRKGKEFVAAIEGTK